MNQDKRAYKPAAFSPSRRYATWAGSLKRDPTLSRSRNGNAAERLDIARRLLLASELRGRRGGRQIEHGKIRITRKPAFGDAQGILCWRAR